MPFTEEITLAISKFFNQNKKVLLLIGRLKSDDIQALINHIKKEKVTPIYRDLLQSQDNDNLHLNISVDGSSVFIFHNCPLENPYIKYNLEPYNTKAIIICDPSLLHPTLDPSIYFAPIKGNKIQKNLLTIVDLTKHVPSSPFVYVANREVKAKQTEKEKGNSSYLSELLNQKLMSSDSVVMQMLADRVLMDDSYKASLLHMLLSWRKNQQMKIAAANVISALCRARVSFSRMDLSHLYIPKANLEGAVLYEADLSSSDLTGGNIRQAIMERVNLTQAKLRDINFEEEPHFVIDKEDSVESICFDKYGELIAASTSQGLVHIWDFPSGDKFCSIEVFPDKRLYLDYAVKSICFSPNSSVIASCSGLAIKIWTIPNGELQSEFVGHSKSVNSICFNPSGNLLASASDDQTVRIVDISDGSKSHILTGHRDSVRHVCFNSDGRYLLSGSNDGTVRVWEVSTSECIFIFNRDSSDKIVSMALSFDGSYLAAASEHKIYIWNFTTRELLNTFSVKTFRVHEVVSSIHFSPDRRFLVSSTISGLIYIWNLLDEQLSYKLTEVSAPCSCVYFYPHSSDKDGYLIAAGLSTGVVKCYRAREDIDKTQSKFIEGHTGEILALSGCSRKDLVVSCSSEAAFLWNMNNYFIIKRFGDKDIITSVALNPSGSLLVIAYERSSIQAYCIEVWDINKNLITYHLLENTMDSSTKINGLHFYNNLLIASTVDGSVYIWDINNGSLLNTITIDDMFDCNSSCVSPNGNLVALNVGNKISVWNIANFLDIKQLYLLKGHVQDIECLAINPDGTLLASGSVDKTIRLWSLETGKLVEEIKTHKSSIGALCFSPNGNWLFSGSYCEVHIWDLKRRKQAESFKGHGGKVKSILFISEDKIVTGCTDHVLRVWEINIQKENIAISLCWVSQSTGLIAGLANSQVIEPWMVDGKDSKIPPGYIDISHAESLSRKNRRLLEQYGAVDRFDKQLTFSQIATFFRMTNQLGAASERQSSSNKDKNRFPPLPSVSLEVNHPYIARCLAFSHDGKFLAVGTGSFVMNADDPGAIYLYELPSRNLIHVFEKVHSGGVSSLCFSTRENLLASGGGDGNICLWNIASKKLVKEIKVKSKTDKIGILGLNVNIDFHPNGKWLVSECDTTLMVWNIENEKTSIIYQQEIEAIRFVLFDPQGKWLIVTQRNMAHVFAIKDFKFICSIKEPRGDMITSIAIHPNGKWLALGIGNVNKNDKSVQLWDIERQILIRRYKGPTVPVKCVAFSKDGQWVTASSSSEHIVYVWNINNESSIAELKLQNVSGFGDTLVRFHPFGHYLVAAGQDNVIRRWNISNNYVAPRKDGSSSKEESKNVNVSSSEFLSGTAQVDLRNQFKPSSSVITELNKKVSPIADLAQKFQDAAGQNKEMLVLAIAGYTEALNILSVDRCIRNPNIGLLLSNLGYAYSQLGKDKIELAIEYHNKALKSLYILLEDDELDKKIVLKLIGSAFNNLGYAYWKKGGKENNLLAIKYYEKAYEILKDAVGENADEIALALGNLAVTITNIGEEQLLYKAILYHKKSIQLQQNFLTLTEERYLTLPFNLACTYIKLMGKTSEVNAQKFAHESIRCYKVALHIASTQKNDFICCTTCSHLGHLFIVKKKYKVAESYFKRALEFRETEDGHCEYGIFLMRLYVRGGEKRLTDAISHLKQAISLAKLESQLNYTHYQTNILDDSLKKEMANKDKLKLKVIIVAYYFLVRCYKELDDNSAIKLSLERLTQLIAQDPSPLHYRLLGYTHQYLGNQNEAEKYFKLALSLEYPEQKTPQPPRSSGTEKVEDPTNTPTSSGCCLS